MAQIDGTPPDDPNVFTDGSVRHGSDPIYALGAYAAYHPKRPLQVAGFTNTEAEMQGSWHALNDRGNIQT